LWAWGRAGRRAVSPFHCPSMPGHPRRRPHASGAVRGGVRQALPGRLVMIETGVITEVPAERYAEKKRERRIRDSRRMVARAYAVVGRWWWPPQPGRGGASCESWEDVFRLRRRAARRLADHLKFCSKAHGCGNGRRHYGDRTWQECRKSLDAIEQLVEEGFLEDAPGQRQVRRRKPWV